MINEKIKTHAIKDNHPLSLVENEAHKWQI